MTEVPGEPVAKACGCGRKFTRAEWDALPFAYVYRDVFERVEYRHCICLSTLGLVLEKFKEDES